MVEIGSPTLLSSSNSVWAGTKDITHHKAARGHAGGTPNIDCFARSSTSFISSQIVHELNIVHSYVQTDVQTHTQVLYRLGSISHVALEIV